jgi:hypothetical protein
MWIIPLVATTVSLFFAMILTGKFMEKRNLHDLIFAISLYMFTIAAFAEFYSTAFNWFTWLYKLYYFPAITLVAVMAAATVYARFHRIVAHVYMAYVAILSLALLISLIPAEVNLELLLASDVTVGGEAMPPEVRRYSFWLSGIGGIVLLGSAIWSWWKTRLAGNLYIALGALVMSMGGGLAKMGWTHFLALSELLGIVILFYGVILLEKGKILFPLAPKEQFAAATETDVDRLSGKPNQQEEKPEDNPQEKQVSKKNVRNRIHEVKNQVSGKIQVHLKKKATKRKS